MKTTTIQYIVRDDNNKIIIKTNHKALAKEALANYGGQIFKRIVTVEELAPVDKDCTVWAQRPY